MSALPERRFDRAAADYDRVRPGYPAAAVDWLLAGAGLGRGDTVVELGAGTGLLTRQLVARGCRTIAVEPNSTMRRVLGERVPEAELIAERVEELPLPSGHARLAVAAQSFHWFEPERALPEIARVLGPGGSLAVVWIRGDERDPLQERIERNAWRLLQEQGGAPGPMPGAALGWEEWFEPYATSEFSFGSPIRGEDLGAYVGSFSVVANLEPAERERRIAEAGGWLEPGERRELPFICQVHLARRRP